MASVETFCRLVHKITRLSTRRLDFPNVENYQKKKEIMARHETLNGRLKQFSCLHDIFRHDLSLHPLYFNAVVNLTQMMIEHGEPLYSVDF